MAKFAVFSKDYSSSIHGETFYFKAGEVKEIIDEDRNIVYFDAIEAVNASHAPIYTYTDKMSALDMSENIKDRLRKAGTTESGGRPIMSKPPTPTPPPKPAYKREYQIGSTIIFDLGSEKLTYTVTTTYLEERSGNNHRIFTLLGEDKEAYAREVYGYYDGGMFPTARSGKDLDEMINCLLYDAEDFKDEYLAAQKVGDKAYAVSAEEDRRNAELELERRALFGKEIVFRVKDVSYRYLIRKSFLEGIGITNDRILTELFPTREIANDFVTRVYQFRPFGGMNNGGFPEWKTNDVTTCKRIIEALHEKCSQVTLDWRLSQVTAKSTISEVDYHPGVDSHAKLAYEAATKWQASPAKKTPVFTGTSEFSKKVDDVSFDGLDVEELSINS